MKAGELRQRITFQTNTPTANSMGEYVDTYTDYATVWGAVEPYGGSLLFSAQQADSQVQGRVRIRYRTDIVPTMRMKFGIRYFTILSIIDYQERHEEWQVLYKEWLD